MATKTAKPGLIDAQSLYTLDEISERLGLGKAALRSARREGLTVKLIGRRGFVLGRDFIEYFEQSARTVDGVRKTR